MLLKDNMNRLLMITSSFQLLITIDKENEQLASDLSPYISLEIRDLGADLIVHPWDFEAHVRLGFIQLLDNHWKGITTIWVFFFPLFRNASAWKLWKTWLLKIIVTHLLIMWPKPLFKVEDSLIKLKDFFRMGWTLQPRNSTFLYAFRCTNVCIVVFCPWSL